MVQFFETTPTPNWSSRLGEAIGQGLSIGAQNRLAEQQRMREHQRNQQALMAQEQRNEQFQIAKENRQQQYEQQQQEFLRHHQLQQSQQEASALQRALGTDNPLQAILSSPEISLEGKKVGLRSILEQQKGMQPKSPLGGLTGQPIPENVVGAIKNVIDSNPGASADELAIEMAQQGIPPVYSNPYIESRRRQDETRASNQAEQSKATRKEQIGFHKESEKYDDQVLQGAKIAKKQLHSIETIRRSLASGNVKPNSIANIFSSLGGWGKAVSKAFLNSDQAAFQTSIPELLEGWKDTFGVRLSDKDLLVVQDKLPDIGKSVEANEAILEILERNMHPIIEREKIARQVKKENQGLRPLGFADEVERRLEEANANSEPAATEQQPKQLASDKVVIIDPNGISRRVPKDMLPQLLQAGAKLSQ